MTRAIEEDASTIEESASTIGDRVKAHRLKRGWSQAGLGSRLGVTQAAISEIERDVTKQSGLLIPMATLFGVDAQELLTGIKISDDAKAAFNAANHIPLHDGVIIKPYHAKTIFGDDVAENDVGTCEPLPFSRRLLDFYRLPHVNDLAVLRAHGAGMSPTIEDGQLLLLNKLETIPESSKIYLVCMDKRLFIKRFVYTPAGWLLRSDNPDKLTYPDFNVSNEDMAKLQIQGRIAWRGGVL